VSSGSNGIDIHKLAMVISVSALMASGCSSVSHQTARDMAPEQIAMSGESCSEVVESASLHDELKWGRMIATPVLTVASAGLIPALLGANAPLDYADRKNASAMREACGDSPLSNQRIFADVATNTGISMGLTAIDLGLGSDVARVQANSSNRLLLNLIEGCIIRSLH
jgi:hypothetical protein